MWKTLLTSFCVTKQILRTKNKKKPKKWKGKKIPWQKFKKNVKDKNIKNFKNLPREWKDS